MAVLAGLALVLVTTLDSGGGTDEHVFAPVPEPVVSAPTRLERLADCIIHHESRGNPRAVNPRSGASGLGQFLPSTWRTTPFAGHSIFDPVANRAAVIWMLQVGRGREFSTLGLC